MRKLLVLVFLCSWPTVLFGLSNLNEVAEVPSGEDVAVEDNQHHAPLYWNLRLRMTLGESERPKHVRLFLPISESRQTVVRRSTYHEPLLYRESAADENLMGYWADTDKSVNDDVISYDLTIRIDGENAELPLTDDDIARRKVYLANELRIQAKHSAIRRQAAQTILPHGAPSDHVRALYDYVHTAIARDRSLEEYDALRTLNERRGNAAGKARLLTALLRTRGIPARMVGGLILRDLKRRRHYTYWVEAEVDGVWVELDPTRGWFGRVPNRYVALFRGDYPLIRHTAKIEFRYEFLVMQTTREAALGTAPKLDDDEQPLLTLQQGNEKQVTDPVASIVWVTDQQIAPSLIEKFSAVASDEQVKLSFMTVPYESKYFRGERIEDMMKSYDHRIREADALILQTRDDAGMYALMSQGERGHIFQNKIIYLNGDMYSNVASFFGHALAFMLGPKDLYIFPDRTDPNSFWDIVHDNFLNGIPITDVAEKWQVPLLQFSSDHRLALSGWRRFLMHTWVRAAKEGVSPQAITLVLILPLIALVIVLYRGVIGFETFGTFTPAIICVAFLQTGILWGVMLFFIILSLGTLLRTALARVHVFLVARMALLLGLVAMVMLLAAIAGIWWGVGPLVNMSVFPMVIMAGIIENFMRTQMEVGWQDAVKLSISTLGLCVASYFVIEWFDLQSIVLVYPELLLVIMALTVLVGLWRGLRLTELWKYYRVGRAL